MTAAILKNPGMRPDLIMQGDPMGRIVVEARFENLGDLWEVEQGARKNEAVGAC